MGIATSSINVGNGVLNRTVEAFTTDAVTAADTTFSFGFKPRLVQFINLTDRITEEWYEGMAATNVLHTVAAGTRTIDTNSLIVVNADGTVTVKASAMVASKSFVIIAEG
jgi:hypothetical protein